MTTAILETNPTSESAALSEVETDRLRDCETRIGRGVKAFTEMGQALAEIRDSRLYRESHDTFESYVGERWQFGRAHAYRLIEAVETCKALSPQGDIPAALGEGHLRPLSKFPPESRGKVWADVRSQCCNRELPTVREIEQVVGYMTEKSQEEPYRSVRLSWKRAAKQRRQAEEEQARKKFEQRSTSESKPVAEQPLCANCGTAKSVDGQHCQACPSIPEDDPPEDDVPEEDPQDVVTVTVRREAARNYLDVVNSLPEQMGDSFENPKTDFEHLVVMLHRAFTKMFDGVDLTR